MDFKNYIDFDSILDREDLLINEFAQKSSWGIGLNDDLEGNESFDIGSRNRFQRDKDRILYTRAFRNLMHKTQVFTSERSGHYRTRLTHTFEVVQIARTIARALGLNEDLTEAIALGHDLGHTPFGHQGERVIDLILSGREDLSGKLPQIDYGGFKHNLQSLKILDILEKKFESFEGLNLSWQVREGIIKHTRTKRKKLLHKPWDITKFTTPKDLYLDIDFSVTLEGQVVAVADEIAQRSSDLDDGLRNNKLMSIDRLSEINDSFKHFLEKRIGIASVSVRKKAIIRDLISYFVNDVIISSISLMEEYKKDGSLKKSFENGRLIYKKVLVRMSDEAQKFDQDLNNYITRKIVNSHNVNCDDGKAVFILKNLFKTYYANPRQMPDYILERMTKEFVKLKKEYPDIKIVNLREDDFDEVYREIAALRCKAEDEDGNFNKVDFSELTKAEQEKHKIFVRTIADYISDMSDTVAIDEFKRLFNP